MTSPTPRKKCETCGRAVGAKHVRWCPTTELYVSDGTGYAPDVAPTPAEGGEQDDLREVRVTPDAYKRLLEWTDGNRTISEGILLAATPPHPASEQPVVERCRAYVTKVCGCECHIYTDQPWRHCITCAKYPAEMIAPSEQPTNNHKEQ